MHKFARTSCKRACTSYCEAARLQLVCNNPTYHSTFVLFRMLMAGDGFGWPEMAVDGWRWLEMAVDFCGLLEMAMDGWR